MIVRILGTGCVNCLRLEALVDQILIDLGRTDVRVEKVDDPDEIRRYIPLDLIPGLVINDVLVSVREVPAPELLRQWLEEALRS